MRKLITALILIMLYVPPTYVAAADVVEVTGPPMTPQLGYGVTDIAQPFTLTDNADRITVRNDGLVYDLYKGATGYNKISTAGSGTVLVYDERVVLEYQSGAQWRQIGTPQSVTYTNSTTEYIVSRHYTDFIGTTYDLNYKFRPGEPTKLEVVLNSGQDRTYRVGWQASGVTTPYQKTESSVADFTVIQFDWNDVTSSLGNITTSLVESHAQGKKLTSTFSVGSVAAGQTFKLDPSVVASSLSGVQPFPNTYQRKIFRANGRYWVFYYDDTYIKWRTSTDGTTWSAATNAKSSIDSSDQFSVYSDGTYVHFADISGWANVGYRRGQLNADGTITWSAARQTAVAAASYKVGVGCDSAGHAWLSYNDGPNKIWANKNANTDGTWSNTAGFPYELGGVETGVAGAPIAQSSETMVVVYVSITDGEMRSQTWTTGGGWGVEQNIDIDGLESAFRWSATGNGADEVYVAYVGSGNIRFRERVSGSWSGATTVKTSAPANACPVMSWVGTDDDVVVFWGDPSSSDHLYYNIRKSNSWGGQVDWGASAEAMSTSNSLFTCEPQGTANAIGFAYTTSNAGNNKIYYDILTVSYDTAPTVTSSAADTITATSGKLYGSITVTGGINPTVRGFEWDTDSGAPYANDWHEHGDYGISDFDHVMDSLPPDTTIYWRAYATNTVGTGYSAERNFKTLLPLPLAPTSLVITQSGIDEITVTWLTGTYADSTTVRIKEDGYPTSPTDGYELYTGALETVTKDGLNFTTTTYYVRAWSTNDTGTSTDYDQDFTGGIGMTLLAFTIVPLALLGMFLVTHVGLLSFAAALAWGVLGFLSYTMSDYAVSGTWDLYYGFFWLCIGLVIACVFLPSVMRPKAKEEVDDVYADDIDRIERENDAAWAATRIPRLGSRGYYRRRRERGK